MTEKEINQLKKILDSNKPRETPKSLDQTVLSEAESQRQQYKAGKQSFVQSVMQPFASGAIAICCTAALLFVFSKVIIPQGLHQQQLAQPSEIKGVELKVEKAKLTDSEPMIVTNQLQPAHPSSTREGLAERYNLPSSELLLSVMKFSKERDRQLAEQQVTIALNDINIMLKVGALDSARERYHQLREYCDDCGLPESLEALAQLEINFNAQG